MLFKNHIFYTKLFFSRKVRDQEKEGTENAPVQRGTGLCRSWSALLEGPGASSNLCRGVYEQTADMRDYWFF
jgi:hypothetical protein